MPKYKDFQFEQGEYGYCKEYYDENAIILAIRNLLLSRPGNFPMNPSIGIDIKKYQFDFLDKQTLSDIQGELNRNISKFIPDLQGVEVLVTKVEDENNRPFLGIAIRSSLNGEEIESNFLFGEDGQTVKVFNEIN